MPMLDGIALVLSSSIATMVPVYFPKGHSF